MVMYLLMHCTSVKTVRLCLTLARELSLPWGASSTLTGCRREARGPGYRSPGAACWCSSLESALSRHRAVADSGRATGVRGI